MSNRAYPAWHMFASNLTVDPRGTGDGEAKHGTPRTLGCHRDLVVLPRLGSGDGLDSLLAARRVLTGKVVGVDLCLEMVENARRNASLLGLQNVEFMVAGIEKLPLSVEREASPPNKPTSAAATPVGGSCGTVCSRIECEPLANSLNTPRGTP